VPWDDDLVERMGSEVRYKVIYGVMDVIEMEMGRDVGIEGDPSRLWGVVDVVDMYVVGDTGDYSQ
jgi:hypothetical protein